MENITNIIYFCSNPVTPSGGSKVIVRHSQILNEITDDKITSSVVFPNDLSFNMNWFEHNAIVKRDFNFNHRTDFIMIPEIWALRFGEQLFKKGFSYGIFVQGGYLIFNNANSENYGTLKSIYKNARLILSISDDTTVAINRAFDIPIDEIQKIQYSIDQSIFNSHIREKENIITYMPRRLPQHSAYLINMLQSRQMKNWNFIPIHGMDEKAVGRMMQRSKIFLSFSDLEGLPLPPLEAAICGNLVIGYTGEGAKEYWHQPNFDRIYNGELHKFCEKVVEKAAFFEFSILGLMSDANAVKNINKLESNYSLSAEYNSLKDIFSRFFNMVG
jgi:hypothetical protein